MPARYLVIALPMKETPASGKKPGFRTPGCRANDFLDCRETLKTSMHTEVDALSPEIRVAELECGAGRAH